MGKNYGKKPENNNLGGKEMNDRNYTEISDGSNEALDFDKEVAAGNAVEIEEGEEIVMANDPTALGQQKGPDFSNIGEAPKAENNYGQPYFDTNQGYVPNVSEVAKFLTNQPVYELTIGINKDELLTFANNSLNIPKRIGYREAREAEFLDLMKGVDITDFQNAKRTYYPSTQAANIAGEGVKSIITIQIDDSTLSQGNGDIRNVVDLARQTSIFEIQRILKHLDTSNLFDPHITVPHKKYEQAHVTEIFVNTSVVLLSFLGLSLEFISNKYTFTVKETPEQFLVHLQKI